MLRCMEVATTDLCRRLPGETRRAHARFLAFVRIPPVRRTLAAVARQTRVSRQAIQRQAQRWDWDARAAAWDRIHAPTAMELAISRVWPDSPLTAEFSSGAVQRGLTAPFVRRR